MADQDSRAGVRYADRAIIEYLDRLHAGFDPALAQAFDAPDKEGMPAIQVGASEGRLLGLLMRLAGARRVVEIGTLAGFSAIHIARELPEVPEPQCTDDDGDGYALEGDVCGDVDCDGYIGATSHELLRLDSYNDLWTEGIKGAS